MELHKYDRSFYPEMEFGGIPRFDGNIEFYSRLNSIITPESVVVDFGCGRGELAEDPVEFRRHLRCLKGKVATVIGLDIDIAARSNPTIDEFRILTLGREWPIKDESVNLVLSHSVLEHLPDPDYLFREARRVLVPGGFLCILTTNLFSYVGLAARLIPNRFHATTLARAQSGRQEKDVFPTLYRCNTVFAVRRQMSKNGFSAAIFGYDGGPGYLKFSKAAYTIGFLHQHFSPSFVKPILMAFGKKLP